MVKGDWRTNGQAQSCEQVVQLETSGDTSDKHQHTKGFQHPSGFMDGFDGLI
jgi:hypothetical protein